jgi:urocanate hydratase
VDLGMVDGSQRSFKTLITVAFLMLTMVFQEEVGLVTKGFICNKRAMEAEPLLKVTIPNIVADNLLDF